MWWKIMSRIKHLFEILLETDKPVSTAVKSAIKLSPAELEMLSNSISPNDLSADTLMTLALVGFPAIKSSNSKRVPGDINWNWLSIILCRSSETGGDNVFCVDL